MRMIFDPLYGRMRRDYNKANLRRDAEIVRLYRQGVTSQALAERYGMSRQRICQIAAKAALIAAKAALYEPEAWELGG